MNLTTPYASIDETINAISPFELLNPTNVGIQYGFDVLSDVATSGIRFGSDAASQIRFYDFGGLRRETAIEVDNIYSVKNPTSTNIVFRTPDVSKEKYKVLQAWEGYVVGLQKDSFSARVTDQKNSHSVADVDFSFDDVIEADHKLIAPGAVFYWTIGFHDSASGIRNRCSTIQFRRLPIWTYQETSAAKQKAKELAARLHENAIEYAATSR